jgi:hypothetical protein
MTGSNDDDRNGLPELIEALRSFRSGQAEVTGGQQAIIEEHAELKKALAGPALVLPGPVISKVDPLAGAPNDKVTITGTRLADVTLVRIGAGRITSLATAPTDTEIGIRVPATATTGEVSVFTPLGVATTEQEFEVVQTSKKRSS